MTRGWRRRLSLAVLLAPLAVGAAAAGAQDLGRIDFPTSGSAQAQTHFLRGALLLHSFEFDDAAEEFRAAEKAEPGFAMAYWGEAMTFNHPLWMEQDAAAARKALEKLAPTPEARLAKAPTEREKMYLSAVEALYGKGDKPAERPGTTPKRCGGSREIPRGRERRGLLRPRAPRDLRGQARLPDLHEGRRGRRRGLREEPAAPRRRPLPDPLLRRSRPRAARHARGPRLREDRARGRPRAPHAVAHLLRLRDVGGGRGVQRGRLEGLARPGRRRSARSRRRTTITPSSGSNTRISSWDATPMRARPSRRWSRTRARAAPAARRCTSRGCARPTSSKRGASTATWRAPCPDRNAGVAIFAEGFAAAGRKDRERAAESGGLDRKGSGGAASRRRLDVRDGRGRPAPRPTPS